jgi:hypothetical protein
MLDLIRKLHNEEALNSLDEARLDSMLETQHESMRTLLSGLESGKPAAEWRSRLDSRLRESIVPALLQNLQDDVPSMTWRSALNDRLLASQARPKRRWSLGWNLAAIGGCAAAIAALWIYQARPTPPAAKAAESIEAKLISAHEDSARAVDLGVASLATNGSEGATNAPPRWSEFDLEAL